MCSAGASGASVATWLIAKVCNASCSQLVRAVVVRWGLAIRPALSRLVTILACVC